MRQSLAGSCPQVGKAMIKSKTISFQKAKLLQGRQERPSAVLLDCIDKLTAGCINSHSQFCCHSSNLPDIMPAQQAQSMQTPCLSQQGGKHCPMSCVSMPSLSQSAAAVLSQQMAQHKEQVPGKVADLKRLPPRDVVFALEQVRVGSKKLQPPHTLEFLTALPTSCKALASFSSTGAQENMQSAALAMDRYGGKLDFDILCMRPYSTRSATWSRPD